MRPGHPQPLMRRAGPARAWPPSRVPCTATGPVTVQAYPGGHVHLVDRSAELIRLISGILTVARASAAAET
ncbi:hypothetical protein [Streptomyces europaeiscabiei]|uniref:hypothetical protein n=1 Tax=Streptomyces europaeiscabiei TaxID=146819 RepID=UPI002E29C5DA|nr:hypothetical protein [Streptomyces europaeiscabiei]